MNVLSKGIARAAPPALRNLPIPIEGVEVAAYEIPTDAPESDGTLEWHSTTLVVVHARAGGVRGIGYTYADAAAAHVVAQRLAPLLEGSDAMQTGARWLDMVRAIRNLGRAGLCATAISAADAALWDLKAKWLGLPLADLLGRCRESIAVYGSGGFTSYSTARLAEQLGGWAGEGMRFVKMKVGRRPDEAPGRVEAARKAIGGQTELFIDANGAYTRKEALAQAEAFAEYQVSWFEEPVSS